MSDIVGTVPTSTGGKKEKKKRDKYFKEMDEIVAEFNYYVHESRSPMEDGVLCCPFDNPNCLEKNLNSNGLGTCRYQLHNGRYTYLLSIYLNYALYYSLTHRYIILQAEIATKPRCITKIIPN